jgi:ABC-2 type transport system permease protein
MSGHLSWYSAPRVALCVLASTVAFTASCVVIFSLAFWVQKTQQLSKQLLDILITFSLYPEPLFDGGLRVLLFTLLPAGFVAYLPARVAHGGETGGATDLVCMLGGAAGYLWLARSVFKAGLRRYSSGSRFGVFG